MNRAFIHHVHRYVARYSVTASAARGQRSPGLVRAARRYLSKVSLRSFAVTSQVRFSRALDRHTERLCAQLPHDGRSWGISRKLLNIFLRNALYTAYLSRQYHLARGERWFEIPLDSIVAKRLRTEARRLGLPRLPRWRGVKHLTPQIGELYQEVARMSAQRHGIARVHLDAIWWGGSRGAAA